MLNIEGLYGYKIEHLAIGIVKAKSYDDAEEKVKAAYLKHSNEYNPECDYIKLKEISVNDTWFSDNPDVIEIDDLI